MQMNASHHAVLHAIYLRSLELGNTHVTEVYTNVEGDTRKKICTWLERQGYIKNVSYYGRELITCDITEKTINYFE